MTVSAARQHLAALQASQLRRLPRAEGHARPAEACLPPDAGGRGAVPEVVRRVRHRPARVHGGGGARSARAHVREAPPGAPRPHPRAPRRQVVRRPAGRDRGDPGRGRLPDGGRAPRRRLLRPCRSTTAPFSVSRASRRSRARPRSTSSARRCPTPRSSGSRTCWAASIAAPTASFLPPPRPSSAAAVGSRATNSFRPFKAYSRSLRKPRAIQKVGMGRSPRGHLCVPRAEASGVLSHAPLCPPRCCRRCFRRGLWRDAPGRSGSAGGR